MKRFHADIALPTSPMALLISLGDVSPEVIEEVTGNFKALEDPRLGSSLSTKYSCGIELPGPYDSDSGAPRELLFDEPLLELGELSGQEGSPRKLNLPA